MIVKRGTASEEMVFARVVGREFDPPVDYTISLRGSSYILVTISMASSRSRRTARGEVTNKVVVVFLV
jgi:hypothetical protein